MTEIGYDMIDPELDSARHGFKLLPKGTIINKIILYCFCRPVSRDLLAFFLLVLSCYQALGLEMSGKKSSAFRFTIIAGSLKGKVITAPDLGVTRPPLTRLRRAIFDFLTPYLESARYLDLFSGTGSYLFEAVSRGAREAVGVEREPRLAEAINNQAQKLFVSDRLHCLCDDVFHALPRLAFQRQFFNVIMIAPPQYVGLIDKTLACLKGNSLLNKKGIIICQHDTSEAQKIDFTGFERDQQRKYGNTTFTLLRQKSEKIS